MSLTEKLLNEALSDKPKRPAKQEKYVNPYLEALKDIERCAKYLRKEDGNIPAWRYEENISVLKEAFGKVVGGRWYK